MFPRRRDASKATSATDQDLQIEPRWGEAHCIPDDGIDLTEDAMSYVPNIQPLKEKNDEPAGPDPSSSRRRGLCAGTPPGMNRGPGHNRADRFGTRAFHGADRQSQKPAVERARPNGRRASILESLIAENPSNGALDLAGPCLQSALIVDPGNRRGKPQD